MIFDYYPKYDTPRGHLVPKVWIMGQIMSVALEPIEEVDESQELLEAPPSPIVPARLTEMTAFPYLVDYCKQSGNATLAYLLEMMNQEEMEDGAPTQDRHEDLSLMDEELLVEARRPASGLVRGTLL